MHNALPVYVRWLSHSSTIVVTTNMHYSMYVLSWILKKFNNSGMELHKYLKFGTLVVLFDPQKKFIWMFDNLVTITESFPMHFQWKAIK